MSKEFFPALGPLDLEDPKKALKQIRRWADDIVRALKKGRTETTEDMSTFEARIAALEGRIKDIYTFPRAGDATVAQHGITLPAGEAGTITEIYSKVKDAPLVQDLNYDLLVNGVVVASDSIAASSSTAWLTGLSLPVAKNDNLRVNVTQIGIGTPGSDLCVQVRVK